MKIEENKKTVGIVGANHVKTVKNDVAFQKSSKIPLETMLNLSNEILTSQMRGLGRAASIARYKEKKSKKPHKVKKTTLFLYIYFTFLKNIYKIREVERSRNWRFLGNRLLVRICGYLSNFFRALSSRGDKILKSLSNPHLTGISCYLSSDLSNTSRS